MRKTLLLSSIFLALVLAGCQKEEQIEPIHNDSICTGPEGAVNGLFSIADGRQVYFSIGNLQWSATGGGAVPATHAVSGGGNAAGIWRFAPHQYDFVGNAGGNVDPGERQSEWMDLFGWATSGYHQGGDLFNVNYFPYSTSFEVINDGPGNPFGYGPSSYMVDPNLEGESANYDWGVYNAISNGGNQPGLWHTLSSEEWDYLLNLRRATPLNGTLDARFAEVVVNGVKGLMLFPDSLVWPQGVNYPIAINQYLFSANRSLWEDAAPYNLAQFALLEKAGCVFLPAAGSRRGMLVANAGDMGYYWFSNVLNAQIPDLDGHYAYHLVFDFDLLDVYLADRCRGYSVRLVQEAK